MYIPVSVSFLVEIKSLTAPTLVFASLALEGYQPSQRIMLAYCLIPRPICLRLLMQDALRADSRAAFKAGSNIPARIAMMAITTVSRFSAKCFFEQAVFFEER